MYNMDGESVILDLIQNLGGAACHSQDLEDLQDWDDAVDICPTLWIDESLITLCQRARL